MFTTLHKFVCVSPQRLNTAESASSLHAESRSPTRQCSGTRQSNARKYIVYIVHGLFLHEKGYIFFCILWYQLISWGRIKICPVSQLTFNTQNISRRRQILTEDQKNVYPASRSPIPGSNLGPGGPPHSLVWGAADHTVILYTLSIKTIDLGGL